MVLTSPCKWQNVCVSRLTYPCFLQAAHSFRVRNPAQLCAVRFATVSLDALHTRLSELQNSGAGSRF